MDKPINLRKAVERKGIKALNIIIQYGRIHFDMFSTLEFAQHSKREEEQTYSVEQAITNFPQYFTYE